MRQRLVAFAIAAAAIVALLGARSCLHDAPWDRLHDDGGGHWSGSIALPRPGRYSFGCLCKAQLIVNGTPVFVRDESGVPIDLDAGVASFEVTAPPGARLVWHPPGRRGPLEYLPASSLSPEPPSRASFPSWAGADPLDGGVLIAIFAILAALALWLARDRLRAIDRRILFAVGGVFVLAAAVRLYDLGGAGQTFDEDVNWSAGRNYAQNLVGVDFRQSSWIWNFQHPPVMKDLVGGPALLEDGYDTARALSALEVAAGCALLCAIGMRLWCRRAGIAAGMVAALMPHLIAHGKVVGHEAPTVLWWTLAVYLCLSPRLTARRCVGLGVVLGLAIFSRFVNGLLAPMIGLTLVVMAPAEQRLRTIKLGLAIIPAVALATGFVLWPRLWIDPIAHTRAAWAILGKGHGKEPFMGALTDAPAHDYFLAYLYATAPLGVLLAVAAFVERVRRRAEWRASVIVSLFFAIPLLAELSPVRQDGVRYVMPSLCALALMAGAGIDRLAGLVARWRHAGIAVVAAFGVYLAIVCARIHPYYLDYYGEQVGGPAGVARSRDFELGWWGEGVDDAVAYVAAHETPGDHVFRNCIEALHLAWWPYDVWPNLVERPGDADWIVVQPALASCPIPAGFVLEHETQAMGAPLVRVYHRPRPQ